MPENILSYNKTDTGLEGKTEHHSFRITVIQDSIIRIKYGFSGEMDSSPSYAVIHSGAKEDTAEYFRDEWTKADPGKVCVREQDSAILVHAGGIQAIIGREPFSLCVMDSAGRMLHRSIDGRAYTADHNGRHYQYFALDGFEDYYGFGEKSGELNKFKKRLRMYNCDTLGYDSEKTDPLYKHIPFFIKRDADRDLACGIFYDCTAEGVLDIGCERSGYWEPYGYFCCDGGAIDCYVIAGDSIKDIVRNYTDLTGKTVMPTYQSLGYMASTMYFTEMDQDADLAIQNFIQEMERQGLGCGGFHLSSGYTSIGSRRYVFNWNRRRFPDPGRFVSWMNDKGVLVSPNVKPALLTDHPLYEEFARAGAFLRNSDGSPYLERYWGGMASFVDFSKEAGRRMWKTHMKCQLLDMGITAIWNDNNEFEITDERAVCGEDGKTSARSIKPVFANLMAKTAAEVMREQDKNLRPYILSRAGYAGIQRYAQTWAGDNYTSWKNLKYNIPVMLGMGLSGVANQGCDVSGFQGPSPDGELFVRWVQNGIFQPRFCIHSCNTDNTVTLPFSYLNHMGTVRDAFRLRYRLGLYLYSLFRQSSVYGDPVMRPMIYEFQQDEEGRNNSFDFMYGPFLLVANVLEQGAVTRRVHLPGGHTWYDWDTHRAYRGGQTIEVLTPLTKIPLFYRSGTILPLVEAESSMSTARSGAVKLLMEISENSSFTIYQDDGESMAYKRGYFLETTVSTVCRKEDVTVQFVSRGCDRDRIRSYEMCLGGRSESPLMVAVNQNRLPLFLNIRDYEQAEEGFYFNMELRQAYVKYKNPGGDYPVLVDYAMKDLIGM